MGRLDDENDDRRVTQLEAEAEAAALRRAAATQQKDTAHIQDDLVGQDERHRELLQELHSAQLCVKQKTEQCEEALHLYNSDIVVIAIYGNTVSSTGPRHRRSNGKAPTRVPSRALADRAGRFEEGVAAQGRDDAATRPSAGRARRRGVT